MKILTENIEIEFGINDIVLDMKEIYPTNLDYDYVIVDPNNVFVFVYDMTIMEETKGFEIIEATNEELEVFNQLITFN